MADQDQRQTDQDAGFRPALGQDDLLQLPPQAQQAQPQTTPTATLATPSQPPATPPQQSPQQQSSADDGFRPITGMGPGMEQTQAKSLGDFLAVQAPRSIADFVSNTLHAAIHPIDTASAFGNLVAGGFKIAARDAGIRNFPENESDQVARAFGKYVADRYGSVDKAKEAFYHDPVGVLSDFSTAATAVGGVAKLATLGVVGDTALQIGKVTNPAFLPSKIVSAPIRALAPKLPGAFDPKTASFDPNAAPPAAAAPVTEDAIRQRAFEIGQTRQSGDPTSDWLQAERELKNPARPAAPVTPPATTATTAAAGNKLVQNVRNILGVAGLVVGGTGAGELLVHHLAGAVLGGGLAYGAVKLIPALLKTPEGQQMLARIGPGSKPAAAAALARDMAPALNTFYKTQQQRQQQQPITLQPPSSYVSVMRAKGGAIDPELARVQREGLRLPGILETLENHK